MRYFQDPPQQKNELQRHFVHGAPSLPKNVERLRQSLFKAANEIDNFNHRVKDWDIWIKSLLEDLELFAMANDPDHPKEFLNLLEHVKKIIVKRLKHGDWE